VKASQDPNQIDECEHLIFVPNAAGVPDNKQLVAGRSDLVEMIKNPDIRITVE
jgi:hypothetical protein